MTELVKRRCSPCEGGVKPLDATKVAELKKELGKNWKVINEGKAIQAQFDFKNYYETTAFVNAVAWISHREDHHPDITVGYNKCQVEYTTHAIGGLSENDFICAAKIDTLFQI